VALQILRWLADIESVSGERGTDEDTGPAPVQRAGIDRRPFDCLP
jgi:hypothetical protein